jgi:hypothetical protein
MRRLWVNPTPEYPDGWAEFAGKEVGRASWVLGHGEEGMGVGAFTLYETPDEGYKLYAVESTIEAADVVRRPEQRAAGGATNRALYSEEEARRKYPELFDRLLKIAED